jgi:hypothetical protein
MTAFNWFRLKCSLFELKHLGHSCVKIKLNFQKQQRQSGQLGRVLAFIWEMVFKQRQGNLQILCSIFNLNLAVCKLPMEPRQVTRCQWSCRGKGDQKESNINIVAAWQSWQICPSFILEIRVRVQISAQTENISYSACITFELKSAGCALLSIIC